MVAVKRDLYIEQGATFTLGFNWYQDGDVVDGVVTPGDPYDLSGASARMQIRAGLKKPALVSAVDGDGGQIQLGEEGRIDITLSDADTDALTVTSGVYDLEVQMADGAVSRVLQGGVTVSLNVTRDAP